MKKEEFTHYVTIYTFTYDYIICCGLEYTYFCQIYDNVNEYAW